MNQALSPLNSSAKAVAKAAKLRRLLELFPALPDSALAPIELVEVLSGRGPSSIRRDILAGKLCQPIHIGPNCSRWPVGAIRQYINAR